MNRFFAIPIALLIAGCSGSGVGSGAGGAPGTDTGKTGLVVYATITPDTHSADVLPSDCDQDKEGKIDQFIHTDLGKIDITVHDKSANPLFQQGVTFNGYKVTYTPLSAHAPGLHSRSHHSTIPIALNGKSEATASGQIVLVDLATKDEYVRTSGATVKPYSYTLTVTYYGRDWVHNEQIRLVTNTQMELGDFCPGTK